MSALDTYILAQAILDGDFEAQLILADLLEEAGCPDLAADARDPLLSQIGALEVAIQLLPVAQAVELGCHFIEHALDGKRADRHAWLLAQLRRLRRFIDRGASAAQYAAAQRGLARYEDRESRWPRLGALETAAHSLAMALDHASVLAASACTKETSRPVRPAGIDIAAVARAMREYCRHSVLPQGGDRWSRLEGEWQIRRTRQALQKLCGPACTS
jgi:hypothetical protein